MDFGKVNTSLLDGIDFTLPADHEQTTRILQQTPKKQFRIYVGCSKWGRTDWIGKIYPKGTKPGNFLDEYAKRFNCIEFNAIYYQLPSPAQVRTWKQKVGNDFLFCPKFSDVITHVKRLSGVEAELQAFLEVLHEFGENLGPVFLMPHPQMGPAHMDLVLSFLRSLPKNIEVFSEFRHPDWYKPPHADRLFTELEGMNRGTVITDSSGRRDCVHMRLTTPDAFIRFVGNGLHPTDYERVDAWVERIGEWIAQGLQSCYFFMHQHDELYSPEMSKYLIEKLNNHSGLSLKVPSFVSQPDLFG